MITFQKEFILSFILLPAKGQKTWRMLSTASAKRRRAFGALWPQTILRNMSPEMPSQTSGCQSIQPMQCIIFVTNVEILRSRWREDEVARAISDKEHEEIDDNRTLPDADGQAEWCRLQFCARLSGDQR